jgi:hypothetical protein
LWACDLENIIKLIIAYNCIKLDFSCEYFIKNRFIWILQIPY